MEGRSATISRRRARPAWLVGLVPLAVLALAIGLFVAFDAPGLDRVGVPQEELAVERTVLAPGEIELHLRNDGADPVEVRQVIVNDGYASFSQSEERIGRLEGAEVSVRYPWIEGQSYELVLLTATGATVDHVIDAAAGTPSADLGFYGLMALIGIYVGVIPVAIGMLWLPWLREVDQRWTRFLLAFTVGLLAFLGVEALLEGGQLAGDGPESLGGAALVWIGAAAAYLALAGADAWLRGRKPQEQRAQPSGGGAVGSRAALLVATGIGLHNLGEGLAIGSAYAVGSLALGAALVVGFALHNTTEGLAIVAPVARSGARLSRLAGLGLLAGSPAVVGAWIGASAFHPSLAAVMFGIGAGAIAQVIVQIAPSVRADDGRLLHPLAVGGMLLGLAVMYATGLLVSV